MAKGFVKTETNEIHLWHVRLVNEEGIYHPSNKGMIVKAKTATESQRIVREVMGKNAHDADLDEFVGYEPEAQIVEFAHAKGMAAEL